MKGVIYQDIQIWYRNNENNIHYNYSDMYVHVEGSKADSSSLDNT
jgi:hypothetical protein